MLLDIKGLPQGASAEELEADARELDIAPPVGPYQGAIQVDLDLVRHEDNVLIKGVASGLVAGECARCLDAYEHEIRTDFTSYAERRPDGGLKRLDRELESDSYLAFHDGIRLEIGDTVREALLLALPIQPLCRPDCKGLCAGCGANLNHEPCRCVEKRAAVPAEDPKR